jgi:hypothetical protein
MGRAVLAEWKAIWAGTGAPLITLRSSSSPACPALRLRTQRPTLRSSPPGYSRRSAAGGAGAALVDAYEVLIPTKVLRPEVR